MLYAGASPWLRIDAALVALAIDGRTHVDKLCAALAEIDSPPARLAALDRLRACRALEGEPAALAELWELAEPQAATVELLPVAAQVARVVGRGEEARDFIRTAARALRTGQLGAFAFQPLLAAGDQLPDGSPWTISEEAAQVSAFAAEFTHWPLLVADVLYRHGQHLIAAGSRRSGEATVREALTHVRALGLASRAEARVYEALAMLARADQNPDGAAEQLAHAAAIYQQLGDAGGLASIGGEAGARRSRPRTTPRCELDIRGEWIQARWLPAQANRRPEPRARPPAAGPPTRRSARVRGTPRPARS